MEFSYSQTENFEMEKLSSDTGYFKKKTVETNIQQAESVAEGFIRPKASNLVLSYRLTMVKPKDKIHAFYNNQASGKGTKKQNKNWNQPFHKVSSFNTIVHS